MSNSWPVGHSKSLTPEERSMRASMAVDISWANTADAVARTQPAPDGFIAKFMLEGEDGRQRIGFAELLELLGEFTAVCHRPVDGGVLTSSVLEWGKVSGHLEGLPGCIWFSVNPTKGPPRHRTGRGAERDVTRWAALGLDLDIKDNAFDDYDQIEKYYHDISGIIGQFPICMTPCNLRKQTRTAGLPPREQIQ